MTDPDRPPPGMIVAVANLKGGTGKSTIAVNLACLAVREQAPVLLVDADPQGTASAWLDESERPAGFSVEARPFGDDSDAWADQVFTAAAKYARIIIDMPPELGAGVFAALGLVDALVIPVTPSAIDLRATAKTLKEVKRAQESRAGRPACLLVPNRVDQRTALGRGIQQALRDLDLEVAPPLAQRAIHSTAFAASQWIGAHAPGSPAFREMAAVAAKLESLLAVAPASDYQLHGMPNRSDLPNREPRPVAVAVHEERRHGARMATSGVDSSRTKWLASLMKGLRLLGRPHTG